MAAFRFILAAVTAIALTLGGASFLAVSPASAQAGAVLKLAPAAGTFFLGSTFDVSIVVDTGPQTINAVAVELRFPPDILQIANPAVGASIISLWTAPPTYSNEEGIVRLQGGIPSPGVKTSQGVVTTIAFRAMRPGSASLVFTGNSQVLANDGRGTNILSLTIGATYRIELPPPQGPSVTSPTHPDQNAWYRSRTPTLQWIAEEGVTDFAWAIDQDPTGSADTAHPKGTATSTSFENLDDGLWYFHIRAKKGDSWGGVTTFLIRIDGTPPAEFGVEFAPRDVTSDRRPFVNFATTDALSGVNRYEIRVISTSGEAVKGSSSGSSFFISVQPPYRLSELVPGGYDVVVRAYDNAGNVRESIGHLTITAGPLSVTGKGAQVGPWLVRWWLLLLAAIAVAAAGYVVYRRQRTRHLRLRGKLEEDLSQVRMRLRRDLMEVSERLAEEEHLKLRLAEQLRRLEASAGAAVPPEEPLSLPPSRGAGSRSRENPFGLDKDNDATPEPKEGQQSSGGTGGGAAVRLIFLVAATALAFSSMMGFAPRAGAGPEGVVVTAEEEAALPVITTYRGQIGSDELLYLGGTAPPNAIVVISFSQEHQEPLIVETRADRDGRWSYLHPRFLQPGVYRVFARTRTDDGVFSDWGPQVTIEVVSRTISVGGVVLSYQMVFGIANILLILIAVGLGATALLFNRKSRLLRHRLAREIHEAESAVQEGFTLLRRDLERELEMVGAADFPTRKFSQEEKARREKLIADLYAIEARVKKEVEDIEGVL